MTQHKSGFVSIIGRPNVGKSTFMNRVIGHKIAIMSDKAQTTRNKIQGVMTRNDAQIIFLDTPGIHKPKHKLGDYMMRVAKILYLKLMQSCSWLTLMKKSVVAMNISWKC